MPVTLGSLTLPDDLVLSGLETAASAVVTSRRTLTGRCLVSVALSPGGRVLTLSSDNHLTLAQIKDIKALEETGLPITLVHHRGTFQVVITGTQVDPTFNYANPADTDEWYSGDITLIEV